MLVSKKEIEKIIRERDKLERLAKIEYEEAKALFIVGSKEFATELQLANQHYGAAQQITRTLKIMGYDENSHISERDRKLIIAGVKQKLCGLGVISVGILSMFTGAIVPFVLFSTVGSTLCITKTNILGL